MHLEPPIRGAKYALEWPRTEPENGWAKIVWKMREILEDLKTWKLSKRQSERLK